ncbi:MAG TPA: DEAD/DEAH box helicase, partial [Solirubrobacteraceae bacterium]
FDYVATYMYEGDTPSAERRAAALSLDRDLLRELLGQEELRELLDADALARVEDDLQHRSELTRATGRDGLHDVLRHVGDLNASELAERVFEGIDYAPLLAELQRERRAISLRIGGEQRFIAADEAGLYRDALSAAPPGGLPEAFLADVPDALRVLVARYARTHGPFTGDELRSRYGVDATAVLSELERDGELVRGELRPGGSGREWCDVEVLRRLRRASLAALRKEIEPAEQQALAAFLPAWQGIDRHASAGAGVDRLREVLVPLQGLALPAEIWERDVLARRIGAYSPAWLDQLCASGELVWVGAGALGRSGRVALYFREDAPLIGPPPGVERRRAGTDAKALAPVAPEHELLRVRLAQGPCFFSDLLAELELSAEVLRETLWDLVWAGEVTNDAWAPLRAPRLALARARPERRASARRFSSRRTGAQSQVQGRWGLTEPIFNSGQATAAAAGAGVAGGPERRRALAELLLERYGILTREQVLAEGIKGGFAMLYDTLCQLETLGICRRGYFVEGMGGAQFALPGAVERLRSARSSATVAQSSAGGSPSELDERRDANAPTSRRTLVLAAADPAQPYGAALPWPKRDGQERRPARVAGAYVVLVDDEPVLYVERGGRGMLTLTKGAASEAAPAGLAGSAQDRVGDGLHALADAVRSGRVPKLALERIDGDSAVGSELAATLLELGFHPGPRRLTLSA